MCEKVYKNKILMGGKSLQLTNVSSKGPKAPTRPQQGPSDHQGPGALKAPKIIKVPGTL